MLEQKRLFKLTIVFGWINQNNGIINQILSSKEFCSLNQKFGCPYNNHILWLNQPKFGWFNQTFFWVYKIQNVLQNFVRQIVNFALKFCVFLNSSRSFKLPLNNIPDRFVLFTLFFYFYLFGWLKLHPHDVNNGPQRISYVTNKKSMH